MNKILKFVLNIIIVYIILLVIYYIARFFNVPLYMYMPYLMWLIVLFIFYLLLGTNHENIYIKFVEKNKKQ
mgnify:CR=1 FL=1